MPINVRSVKELSLSPQSLDYKNLARNNPHLKNLPIEIYLNAVPTVLVGLDHFD